MNRSNHNEKNAKNKNVESADESHDDEAGMAKAEEDELKASVKPLLSPPKVSAKTAQPTVAVYIAQSKKANKPIPDKKTQTSKEADYNAKVNNVVQMFLPNSTPSDELSSAKRSERQPPLPPVSSTAKQFSPFRNEVLFGRSAPVAFPQTDNRISSVDSTPSAFGTTSYATASEGLNRVEPNKGKPTADSEAKTTIQTAPPKRPGRSEHPPGYTPVDVDPDILNTSHTPPIVLASPPPELTKTKDAKTGVDKTFVPFSNLLSQLKSPPKSGKAIVLDEHQKQPIPIEDDDEDVENVLKFFSESAYAHPEDGRSKERHDTVYPVQFISEPPHSSVAQRKAQRLVAKSSSSKMIDADKDWLKELVAEAKALTVRPLTMVSAERETKLNSTPLLPLAKTLVKTPPASKLVENLVQTMISEVFDPAKMLEMHPAIRLPSSFNVAAPIGENSKYCVGISTSVVSKRKLCSAASYTEATECKTEQCRIAKNVFPVQIGGHTILCDDRMLNMLCNHFDWSEHSWSTQTGERTPSAATSTMPQIGSVDECPTFTANNAVSEPKSSATPRTSIVTFEEPKSTPPGSPGSGSETGAVSRSDSTSLPTKSLTTAYSWTPSNTSKIKDSGSKSPTQHEKQQHSPKVTRSPSTKPRENKSDTITPILSEPESTSPTSDRRSVGESELKPRKIRKSSSDSESGPKSVSLHRVLKQKSLYPAETGIIPSEPASEDFGTPKSVDTSSSGQSDKARRPADKRTFQAHQPYEGDHESDEYFYGVLSSMNQFTWTEPDEQKWQCTCCGFKKGQSSGKMCNKHRYSANTSPYYRPERR